MTWPLYVKLELRAMTKSQRMRLSAVMISSTIPSAKYSCSGSPLILAKGNTAMDGLSGSGSAGGAGVGALLAAANPVDAHSPRDIFDLLLAQILKGEIELVAHLIAHDAAEQIPPGAASDSKRAATFTPSP